VSDVSKPSPVCRSCGEPITRRFCSGCGLDSQCGACGATLLGAYCGECGTPSPTAEPGIVNRVQSKTRPKWLLPAAITALVVILIGSVIAIAGSNSDGSDSQAIADSGNEIDTTTTQAPTTSTTASPTTTTAPTTTIAVSCPTDQASLKAKIVEAGFSNASTMSHMGVQSGSIKNAMGTKYIYFRLAPIDEFGSQGGGVFMRCDSGGWAFLGIVDGYSCDPTWVGDDKAAAVTFKIC